MGGMSGSKSANRKLTWEEKRALEQMQHYTEKEAERINTLNGIIGSNVDNMLKMQDISYDENGKPVWNPTKRGTDFLKSGLSLDEWIKKSGASTENYEAGLMGAVLQQAAKEFKDTGIESGLETNVKDAIAKRSANADIEKNMYDLVRSYQTGTNRDTLNLLYERANRAAQGRADPAVERELAKSEANLQNKMRKQLGASWGISSAGIRNMGEFAKFREEAVSNNVNKNILATQQATQSWFAGQNEAVGGLNSYQQGQAQNIGNYLTMYNDYKNQRINRQNAMIAEYFKMQGGIFGRNRQLTSDYMSAITMPYTNSYAQVAGLYGQQAGIRAGANTIGTTPGSTFLTSPLMGGAMEGGSMMAAAGIAAAVANSDRRLKLDIIKLGLFSLFRYIWDLPQTIRIGIMSDEINPVFVSQDRYGFDVVDYIGAGLPPMQRIQ